MKNVAVFAYLHLDIAATQRNVKRKDSSPGLILANHDGMITMKS